MCNCVVIIVNYRYIVMLLIIKKRTKVVNVHKDVSLKIHFFLKNILSPKSNLIKTINNANIMNMQL